MSGQVGANRSRALAALLAAAWALTAAGVVSAQIRAKEARVATAAKSWAATTAKSWAATTASRPPMGWSSSHSAECEINENDVRRAADALVARGLRRAGYEYVVVDECWHGGRDTDGFLGAAPQRFPSGMNHLAQYVHSKGLKLGIHAEAGFQTCEGNPGSRGFEFQDARTFADWGVDYVRYDFCDPRALDVKSSTETMARALQATNRQIVFALNESGATRPWSWAPGLAHLWRTTGDTAACFDCELNPGTGAQPGILSVVARQAELRRFAGPSHWNDPGMLQVGSGMSDAENRAHMGLWALLAAPLFVANDPSVMPERIRQVLTNQELIAVDQDPLGVPGFRLLSQGALEVWVRPLSAGELAVGFLNRGSEPFELQFDWSLYSIEEAIPGVWVRFAETPCSLRNLWSHSPEGDTRSPLVITVAPHDLSLYRLRPVEVN